MADKKKVKKSKFLAFMLLAAGLLLLVILFLASSDIAVLNPKGTIASQERNLIVTATLLMLIVVIPVFILTFFIAWKYRAGNKSAKYNPDWDHNRAIEFTWWAIPAAIILVLAAVTWNGTHQLDPFKPLSSTTKSITIQVVALQWKWLFIYPEQNIASLNFVQFPIFTPISFEITADAPMNSFWIPSLAGQVYAMPGMKTNLHLMASEVGSYKGSSANISGRGFSSMKFIAKASLQSDFESWVESVKSSPNYLSLDAYHQLAAPSQDIPVTFYSSTQPDLLDKIVMKFMMPMPREQGREYIGELSNYGTVSHY